MIRRRKQRSVQILVSGNFYDMLESERKRAEFNYKNIRRPRGRYRTSLSFPAFTEMLCKDFKFSNRKRSGI